jgi:MoaA/NifB/PqqE/SkfB family radical SAM enzyme
MNNMERRATTIDEDLIILTSPDGSNWAHMDEEGRLILPAEWASKLAMAPDAQVHLEERVNGYWLRRPVIQLAKIHIEPTSLCNLACRTCIRNIWSEAMGNMSRSVFQRLVEGIRELPAPPAVIFGGFGEPLAHPEIAEMVAQVKSVAASVELITNGMLLTPHLSQQLVDAGLDLLWVSMDGVTPESYADIRWGGILSKVMENIANLHKIRRSAKKAAPKVGISFVVMRRNVADLPKLIRLSTTLGISHYLVTNVLPYTEEMCAEVLYSRSVQFIPSMPSKWTPQVNLPRIDVNELTSKPLERLFHNAHSICLNGDSLIEAVGRCPFISRGIVAITWDGNLSPCLPLMHDHSSYIEKGRKRFSRRYVVGNLMERSLKDLWLDPQYVRFRHKVQEFDFSPCLVCGGCDLSEANEEDCYGNTFPTCGGCLWSQGVIQCP